MSCWQKAKGPDRSVSANLGESVGSGEETLDVQRQKLGSPAPGEKQNMMNELIY